MIMSAIEALNDPNDSNKLAISRQIEATYGELPAAHTTLLSQQDEAAWTAGDAQEQLHEARPQRGRQPKPKSSLPIDIVASLSRLAAQGQRPFGTAVGGET
ncbi:hypothetical protein Vadar_009324 [Vaccinium darrowii]|uniref:Uncharacterized protein n=1 Tax=Vaccinium darrowii TaxID=229202 RepID=A0ACB7YKB5_9ERIC|nr:hypothetical protein Vadar_009324 [Vaccinium darrowii]